jgi:hypothetical protein
VRFEYYNTLVIRNNAQMIRKGCVGNQLNGFALGEKKLRKKLTAVCGGCYPHSIIVKQ